jgi:hypothetical protein
MTLREENVSFCQASINTTMVQPERSLFVKYEHVATLNGRVLQIVYNSNLSCTHERSGLDSILMDSIIDRLPVEIILLITHFLSLCEVKQLSQVNKLMRVVCAPPIFQSIRLEFSYQSLQKLEALAVSELRHHVLSVTYVVPELLKEGALLMIDGHGSTNIGWFRNH